ncbi:hypothetical protein [Qipengyuania sp. MTN3-11]|uniref:hypothetical protein n=1 Tax=Qipengyuania sp. MTN3-11 TaxID=3056557 RepID=UPI0036F3B7D1
MSHGNKPLSSHPAFRFVVALWFAALLGFGTFVLPAGVLERAAQASGLASFLPSAAPPLGDTARLTISIAAAMVGALLGLLVAGRASRDENPGSDREEVELPAPETPKAEPETRRRPLLVREDLAVDFGSPAPEEPAIADAPAPEPALQEDPAPLDEPVPEVEVALGEDSGAFEEETAPADDIPDEFFAAEPPSTEDYGSPSEADAPFSAPAADDDLAALGSRLEVALEDYRRRFAQSGNEPTESPGNVTFLRRDSAGTNVAMDETHPNLNPQAQLREALDKLSRLGRDG